MITDVSQNVKVSAYFSSIKNPVLVDLLTGHISEIKYQKGEENNQVMQKLPLVDYPLIVTDISNVIVSDG